MHVIPSRCKRPALGLGAVLGFVMLLISTGVSHAQASVDDFSFSSWDVEMSVSKTDSGHSQAHVKETLVANFNIQNQNKGLVRTLPKSYEDASLEISNVRVSDASGQPSPFESESEDGSLRILTGTDEYVNGIHTYVIEYDLGNVIHSVTDDKRGKIDELYWNLLPADRAQPITRFSATIDFDEELTDSLTGHNFCYYGYEGLAKECEISADGSQIKIPNASLYEYEGVTAAVGLEQGSVTQPFSRSAAKIMSVAAPVTLGLGIVSLVAGWIVRAIARYRGKKSGRGIVVPQYEVPFELPPALAAIVTDRPKTPFQAQVIHLAVNRAIVIQDLDAFGAKGLTLVKQDAKVPTEVDKDVMLELFANSSQVDVVKRKPNRQLQKASAQSSKTGLRMAREQGYVFAKSGRGSFWLGIATMVLGAIPAIGYFFNLLPLGWLFGGGVVVFLGVFLLAKNTVLTPKGAQAREFLLGVREFIKVAEQARFKMLQSYDGAERTSDGHVDIVHLYERLLPYAILFGQEKSWARNLEVVYEQSQSSAYAWAPAFHDGGVSGLSSGLRNFGESMTSASSSSSGSSGSGSSGGGSVGGGGGGGSAGGR